MGRQDIKSIRRAELIDAVMITIHRYGFADLTVSQIAKEAETSTGSIHYYFGGKDALLEATMRHLLSILKDAISVRMQGQTDPKQRLIAVVTGNFDALFFTDQSTSVWVQFWAYAPYSPSLARLQMMNKNRIRSNLRAELKRLLPKQSVETARIAIQSYMDGVWVHAAQSGVRADANTVQTDAVKFLELLLDRS
ncbi:transcriptional regulator BetI [Amylibacter sp. SFDW26]|uniref:choline-binding transcriptional repressor BetI n=1 Tax=Amylibacter sp. SFDW26 TaxID=2652722 RepID=UPI001261EBE1|nr:transcriptional regulator BetI [Amylibacter sp. SFDW26]KAB7613338.1 transcriptional regulator BetI [Amylibacter sp. SFDW26]